ncbi:hypothetical protein CCAN2_940002 [Capnocytophaga canimorsus]|nr:hypothetical protein CCAN2_940002 [Capnocytophaga canimorsus]
MVSLSFIELYIKQNQERSNKNNSQMNFVLLKKSNNFTKLGVFE